MVLAILVAASGRHAVACWQQIPDDKLVAGSPVVVVGEVERIERASILPVRLYMKAVRAARRLGIRVKWRVRLRDTAMIHVEEVLKNGRGDRQVAVGRLVALEMPASCNVLRVSTDIFYKNGQRGVWILDYAGKRRFAATYPGDYRPVSERNHIAAIIARQR
jgi:hypothetical protein